MPSSSAGSNSDIIHPTQNTRAEGSTKDKDETVFFLKTDTAGLLASGETHSYGSSQVPTRPRPLRHQAGLELCDLPRAEWVWRGRPRLGAGALSHRLKSSLIVRAVSALASGESH